MQYNNKTKKMTKEYQENIESIFEIATEKSKELEDFLSPEQKKIRRTKVLDELKVLCPSLGLGEALSMGVIFHSFYAAGVGLLVGSALPLLDTSLKSDRKYRDSQSRSFIIDTRDFRGNSSQSTERKVINACDLALSKGELIDEHFIHKTKHQLDILEI